MDRRRRAASALAAACALTCALTVLATTAANVAVAPPAHAAPSPAPGGPREADGTRKKSLEDVRAEIEGLYRQAGAATDAYNLAEEQAEKQSAEIARLSRAIADGRTRIDRLRQRAGAAARAQYRSGGIPEEARLVLTDDPQLFLDGAGRLVQGQKATRDLLAELERRQQDLETYTQDAGTEWNRLEQHRSAQQEARKHIDEKIAAAEKLESRLAAEERTRLRELEQRDRQRQQTAWLESGALKEINRAASPQGRDAIAFATAQIGKPYVWGAEGPDSYDCSGLTQRAWGTAGRGIPRTSQEQWRLLPRVAVKDMRPGDLIIYYADATHVGMYIGDGSMVHAPRPGRDVTVAGAGSMPILGVVRPDK
ncbi:C40 family peptidase [Streptomyces sp. MUM 203J]|uniref:C40 family peptidase n=1 Tax=Streptomyces sp. MUM 203J TaxID=2791990 RepID=UPI001F03C6C7|nr:C40 family peptidase [Streptomyces sp. MUM 203J]